ncbi:MAG: hypothetical protein GX941_02595 [Candidatus Methanofastidiosa archaeon]|jgi:hypothetical protein|nr:hypothetical protein [Candidatus Methanofastidiosa archaeon]
MQSIADEEMERAYRVIDQSISMHSYLRDRYALGAFLLEVGLLACSVVFCATTFIPDDSFIKIGLLPGMVYFILGVSSILSFFASLVAWRVDWKGKSISHRDAVQKMSQVKSMFRSSYQENKKFSDECKKELLHAYWDANINSIEIPDNMFVKLKLYHLCKIELSKMASNFPGCPFCVLRMILICRSIRDVIRYYKKSKDPINVSSGNGAKETNKAC